jgi:hypothetical protein
MYVLRIEHAVPSYEGWKRAFDADPMGRVKSGVRAHRVYRAVDDPSYVLIDLEFDTAEEAETMLAGLRRLWGNVTVMRDPRARVVELSEDRAYER